jgi:hypothetical protein
MFSLYMGIGVGAGVGVGIAVGTNVGVGVGIGVGVGSGVDLGTGVGDGIGVGVTVGVGAEVAVGNSGWTNRTMTVWVAIISIFAVLPDTPKTGPIHSSTFQPDLGRTSIVTVRPET